MLRSLSSRGRDTLGPKEGRPTLRDSLSMRRLRSGRSRTASAESNENLGSVLEAGDDLSDISPPMTPTCGLPMPMRIPRSVTAGGLPLGAAFRRSASVNSNSGVSAASIGEATSNPAASESGESTPASKLGWPLNASSKSLKVDLPEGVEGVVAAFVKPAADPSLGDKSPGALEGSPPASLAATPSSASSSSGASESTAKGSSAAAQEEDEAKYREKQAAADAALQAEVQQGQAQAQGQVQGQGEASLGALEAELGALDALLQEQAKLKEEDFSVWLTQLHRDTRVDTLARHMEELRGILAALKSKQGLLAGGGIPGAQESQSQSQPQSQSQSQSQDQVTVLTQENEALRSELAELKERALEEGSRSIFENWALREKLEKAQAECSTLAQQHTDAEASLRTEMQDTSAAQQLQLETLRTEAEELRVQLAAAIKRAEEGEASAKEAQAQQEAAVQAKEAAESKLQEEMRGLQEQLSRAGREKTVLEEKLRKEEQAHRELRQAGAQGANKWRALSMTRL